MKFQWACTTLMSGTTHRITGTLTAYLKCGTVVRYNHLNFPKKLKYNNLDINARAYFIFWGIVVRT